MSSEEPSVARLKRDEVVALVVLRVGGETVRDGGEMEERVLTSAIGGRVGTTSETLRTRV